MAAEGKRDDEMKTIREYNRGLCAEGQRPVRQIRGFDTHRIGHS